jgi:hypothetical protein
MPGVFQFSKTAALNSGACPTVDWAEGQSPSSINDSSRAEMAAVACWRDDISGSLLTTGTSTAYLVASNQQFDSLAHMDGQNIAITMHTTCATGATLNVDSLGAKTIEQGTGVGIGAGVLAANSVYTLTYNNTLGVWLVRDQAVNGTFIPAGSITYSTIQNESAHTLLGNPTGGAASPSEITLGGGLAFSGTSLVSTVNPALFPGFIAGLTLSAAGGTGTFGIAAGVANDVANGGIMSLGSAYTKTTASWAVGSGNGSLDTGAIAAGTWYHVFLIERTDTGVVDVLFSLSATTPTMPTSYTLSRRIGSMKTDGSSHWLAFTQTVDTFLWGTLPAADQNNVTVSSSRAVLTVAVPTGVVVAALIWASLNATTGTSCNISSIQNADAAPNTNSNTNLQASNNTVDAVQLEVLTTTTATIGVRSNTSSAATLTIQTIGWKDSRGKV